MIYEKLSPNNYCNRGPGKDGLEEYLLTVLTDCDLDAGDNKTFSAFTKDYMRHRKQSVSLVVRRCITPVSIVIHDIGVVERGADVDIVDSIGCSAVWYGVLLGWGSDHLR